MTDSRLAELLSLEDGRAVSRETLECLRLLKSFIKLSSTQRREIIDLAEKLRPTLIIEPPRIF